MKVNQEICQSLRVHCRPATALNIVCLLATEAWTNSGLTDHEVTKARAIDELLA